MTSSFASRGVLTIGLIGLLCGAQPARAQPMMANPQQMSGIPRPDSQVPPGTITVRLIKGQLGNNLAGKPVELIDKNDESQHFTATTDAEGRATFARLQQGTYEARADHDGEALASQPIELGTDTGVRVMLVFSQSLQEQQKELGKPDGKARVDLQLPGGQVVVTVIGPDGKPLEGAQVALAHAIEKTEKVEQVQARTGPDGVARFSGQAAGSGDGYLVQAVHGDRQVRSQPFRLVDNHGTRVGLELKAAVKDPSRVTISRGSHFVLEMSDDSVQVIEVLRLQNSGTEAVDPGPRGLRVPLAEGALSAQSLPGASPQQSLDLGPAVPEAVWRGLIPPGQTVMQVGFVLHQHGSLHFHQPVKTRFEDVRALMPLGPGMKPTVEGSGYSGSTHRIKDLFPNFDGPSDRELLMVSGSEAGSAIDFTIEGLPAAQRWPRYLAGVIALSLAIGFALLAARGPAEQADTEERRAALERRRQALLEQILQAEQSPKQTRSGDPKRLRAELEKVYRELDQL